MADTHAVVPDGVTKGNGDKLHLGRLKLHIRKKKFTDRIELHLNRLPAEAVNLHP